MADCIFDKLRGTGRTTRMLEAAVKAAKQGTVVYVVMDNQTECNRAATLLRGLGLGWDSSMGQIFIVTPQAGMDWANMRVTLTQKRNVTLVDHYTIEDNFAKMLQELHAYDAPIVVEGGGGYAKQASAKPGAGCRVPESFKDVFY